MIAPLSYELPLMEPQCRYYIATKGNSVFRKMGKIVITIDEENLDSRFRMFLAERQSEGRLTVEKVVVTDYKVVPPTKRGTKPKRKPQPEKFVEAVKYVINHAALQNNQVKSTIENGVPTRYCFWLDNEGWCKAMDKLLAEHRDLIVDALEHKYQADSVNLLAPFIGEIIGLGLFQKTPIQKTDLLKSFTAYYNKPMASVQSKLSTSYPNWAAFNNLVGEIYKLAPKKNKKRLAYPLEDAND